MCLQYTTNFSGSHPLLRAPQHVMQGARNIVMRDSTFYVAQNVCPVITALWFEILSGLFVKIEVHEHGGQDDTLLVSSAKTQFKCLIYRS